MSTLAKHTIPLQYSLPKLVAETLLIVFLTITHIYYIYIYIYIYMQVVPVGNSRFSCIKIKNILTWLLGF